MGEPSPSTPGWLATFSGRPYPCPFLCPDFQTLRVVFTVLAKGCYGVSLTCFAVYKPELFPTSLR